MQINTNPTKKLESGYQIPYIGFGTYLMRGQECYEGVKKALEVGYTHIDTASIYRNQEQIGQLLKQLKVDRKTLYITSKIAPGQQGYNQAKEACQNILKRLGTNYLDLLIIHWPGVSKYDVTSPKNSQIRRQTWRALIDLKKEGKVRDIGVSNYLKHHLQDLMKHSDVKPAINQFELHPLLWEKQTIDFCRQHNIVIEAYSPLARADGRLFKNSSIMSIAKKHHKTVAQICLRWALQHDFIILPKSSDPSRIAENFKVTDFQLDQEDMKAINELSKLEVRVCWNPHSITC